VDPVVEEISIEIFLKPFRKRRSGLVLGPSDLEGEVELGSREDGLRVLAGEVDLDDAVGWWKGVLEIEGERKKEEKRKVSFFFRPRPPREKPEKTERLFFCLSSSLSPL